MINRINDQPAFVLHRRDYHESSLILEIFSEDFGRLSVLAKSARKRRDAAHFQICNRLLLGWSGQSELKTLTQIEGQDLAIAADYLPSVFYINELLLYLLPKHDEQPDLFGKYQMLLLSLAHTGSSTECLQSRLRNFEIELLSALGVMPDLSCDYQTQQGLDDHCYYRLDAQQGPLLSQDQENAYLGEVLSAIHHRRFESAAVLRAAKHLMRKIIDYNLQGRTLQSRHFYQQMKKK